VEAARRLSVYGANRLRPVKEAGVWRLFLSQFAGPGLSFGGLAGQFFWKRPVTAGLMQTANNMRLPCRF
jgi:hypothetical protein